MMNFKHHFQKVAEVGVGLSLISALILAGCGGGGTTSAATTSITGTAAAGAPIVGLVSAKDSTGKTFGPATIDATGAYTLEVTGGTAPFILEASGISAAGNIANYHSIATATGGNVNITPLTEMVVAQAAGRSPATVMSCTGVACLPAKAQVDIAETFVNTSLSNLFSLFGVTAQNLLTSNFSAGATANQSAIDVLLDAISVTAGAGTTFNIIAASSTGLAANTILVTLPASGTAIALTVNPLLNASAVAAASSVSAKAVLGGVYTGTYSGGDSGTVSLTQSANGDLTGKAISSNPANGVANVTGTTTADGTATAGVAGGSTFTGTIARSGAVSGTWTNGTLSGTFTASKMNLSSDFSTAAHTGTYTGTESGNWTMKSSSAGIITGGYSWVGGSCSYTGTVTQTGIITSTSTTCGATFKGVYSPKRSPVISGTWTNTTNGGSGTFTGS